MLMGMCQNIMAQEGDSDYSLKGIYNTLSQYDVVSLEAFHNGLARIEIKQNGQSLYGAIK